MLWAPEVPLTFRTACRCRNVSWNRVDMWTGGLTERYLNTAQILRVATLENNCSMVNFFASFFWVRAADRLIDAIWERFMESNEVS